MGAEPWRHLCASGDIAPVNVAGGVLAANQANCTGP
jgi:hypothetical protein